MSELTQTLKDGDQRLVLRQSFKGQDEALDELEELLATWELDNIAVKKLGNDSQLLHLKIVNEPTRGQRFELEAVFVTQEWRHRKRQKAGRHS